MLALYLVQLFFPLSVLLHNLQTTPLTELVHTLHFLRHLAQLLQRLFLEQQKSLACRFRDKIVQRYLLVVFAFFNLDCVLLKPAEDISE